MGALPDRALTPGDVEALVRECAASLAERCDSVEVERQRDGSWLLVPWDWCEGCHGTGRYRSGALAGSLHVECAGTGRVRAEGQPRRTVAPDGTVQLVPGPEHMACRDPSDGLEVVRWDGT